MVVAAHTCFLDLDCAQFFMVTIYIHLQLKGQDRNTGLESPVNPAVAGLESLPYSAAGTLLNQSLSIVQDTSLNDRCGRRLMPEGKATKDFGGRDFAGSFEKIAAQPTY